LGESFWPGADDVLCKPKNSFTVSKNETLAAFVPITVKVKNENPIAAAIANLAAVKRNDLWLVNITMNSSNFIRKLLETRTVVAPLGNPGRNYTYIKTLAIFWNYMTIHEYFKVKF